MLRAPLVSLCRLFMRVFFRRVEVLGLDQVPDSGGIVFVLNHPSGLIDPLFVLCHAQRRISFLAKEPLFRMPLVSLFVKAFECLPVYRAIDGANPQKNHQMMQQAVNLLTTGNALALFPEGTSHSEPTLKPLKSGAARIALSACGLAETPIYVVPAALYYENKETFRSRAVLAIGQPIEVDKHPLDAKSEAPRSASTELTENIRAALSDLLPTANSIQELLFAEKVERMLEATKTKAKGYSSPSLGERMHLRAQLLAAYRRSPPEQSKQTASLLHTALSLIDSFEHAELKVDATFTSGKQATLRQSSLMIFALLLALIAPALIGTLIFLPAYQLVRYLAFRVAGQELDIVATVKLISGALFVLFTLLLTTFAGYFFAGPRGLLALPLAVTSAWSALRFFEILAFLRRRAKYNKSLRQEKHSLVTLEQERASLARAVHEWLRDAPEGQMLEEK